LSAVVKHRGNPVGIPDFQTVVLPLVEALADGQERTMRDLTDLLADRFKLTEQERQGVLPSGQKSVFSNRVAWAKSHLKCGDPSSVGGQDSGSRPARGSDSPPCISLGLW
jgi:restriction system protein